MSKYKKVVLFWPKEATYGLNMLAFFLQVGLQALTLAPDKEITKERAIIPYAAGSGVTQEKSPTLQTTTSTATATATVVPSSDPDTYVAPPPTTNAKALLRSPPKELKDHVRTIRSRSVNVSQNVGSNTGSTGKDDIKNRKKKEKKKKLKEILIGSTTPQGIQTILPQGSGHTMTGFS